MNHTFNSDALRHSAGPSGDAEKLARTNEKLTKRCKFVSAAEGTYGFFGWSFFVVFIFILYTFYFSFLD